MNESAAGGRGRLLTLKAAIAAGVLTAALSATAALALPSATAPALSSSGVTLQWTAVSGASAYRVEEVTSAGAERSIYLGDVFAYTPAAQPGSAVVFKVKSRPPAASGWSNPVTIVYPPEESQAERERRERTEREARLEREAHEREAREAAEREAQRREEQLKAQEEVEVREREELARKGPVGSLSPTGPFDCAGLLTGECEYQYFGCKPPLCSTNFALGDPPPADAEEVGPLSAVTSARAYEELFARVQSAQAGGRPVILSTAGAESSAELQYSLATFFLFDNGRDYIEQAGDPGWSGWFAHFGFTVQGVRKYAGIWTRSAAEGLAVVSLPGTATQTIELPYEMSTAAGSRVSSITLSGGQGVVLQCNPIPSRGDCPGYGSYGEREEVPASLNPFPFVADFPL